MVATVVRGRR